MNQPGSSTSHASREPCTSQPYQISGAEPSCSHLASAPGPSQSCLMVEPGPSRMPFSTTREREPGATAGDHQQPDRSPPAVPSPPSSLLDIEFEVCGNLHYLDLVYPNIQTCFSAENLISMRRMYCLWYFGMQSYSKSIDVLQTYFDTPLKPPPYFVYVCRLHHEVHVSMWFTHRGPKAQGCVIASRL